MDLAKMTLKQLKISILIFLSHYLRLAIFFSFIIVAINDLVTLNMIEKSVEIQKKMTNCNQI